MALGKEVLRIRSWAHLTKTWGALVTFQTILSRERDNGLSSLSSCGLQLRAQVLHRNRFWYRKQVALVLAYKSRGNAFFYSLKRVLPSVEGRGAYAINHSRLVYHINLEGTCPWQAVKLPWLFKNNLSGLLRLRLFANVWILFKGCPRLSN